MVRTHYLVSLFILTILEIGSLKFSNSPIFWFFSTTDQKVEILRLVAALSVIFLIFKGSFNSRPLRLILGVAGMAILGIAVLLGTRSKLPMLDVLAFSEIGLVFTLTSLYKNEEAPGLRLSLSTKGSVSSEDYGINTETTALSTSAKLLKGSAMTKRTIVQAH